MVRPVSLVVSAIVVVGLVAGALATTRPGRQLSASDAMKELDLIRPAREKLAHDFALPIADGRTFRLAEQRGKVVFINFWATWCGPCREEMPAMERLWRTHRERGLVVVAVSVDSDPSLIGPYVRQGGYTFPIALDPKLTVANTYGVRALPSSFFVDKQGQLTALALGPRAWDTDAAHSLIEALVR